MKNTAIEWAHHTVNFWWGCVFARLADGTVRQECVNCYALMLSKLFSRGKATWGAEGNRMLRVDKASAELVKLDASARKRGVRERIFINSMSDTFEDRRDLDAARAELFYQAALCTNLEILLLTKRPENVTRMVPKDWLADWPAHVWMGTTAGTKAAADEAVPALLKVPAKVRFLSMEPLLEAVELSDVTRRSDCVSVLGKPALDGIHWVICGGESGPKARPMHPDWARRLRDQCKAAGVPFFFKQWGEWYPAAPAEPGVVSISIVRNKGEPVHAVPKDPEWHTFPAGQQMARVGKKAAGRFLDGVEHNAVPSGSQPSALSSQP